jgi:AAHS family 4-hydroxybenzoate transporter-like MFS transporter
LLLIVFGGVGLGLQAGMIGQAAVAVSIYPHRTVATGVGWASSMGRLGSVIGPIVGGALIGLGTSTSTIVLLSCVPVSAALVLMVVLGRMRTAADDSDNVPTTTAAPRDHALRS